MGAHGPRQCESDRRYRRFLSFFDATPHAEFLYALGQSEQTIEQDLPNEALFLRRYDQFRGATGALVDMPDQTIDLLFRMLRQNDGRLSRRARQSEFAQLTDAEAQRIEQIFGETFEQPMRTRCIRNCAVDDGATKLTGPAIRSLRINISEASGGHVEAADGLNLNVGPGDSCKSTVLSRSCSRQRHWHHRVRLLQPRHRDGLPDRSGPFHRRREHSQGRLISSSRSCAAG